MFGYLRPDMGELKMREVMRYKAHYCGLCKALGARCGPLCRLLLRYDLVALSLGRGALCAQDMQLLYGRCPYNPLQKITYLKGENIDYAAGLHLLLWQIKAEDDIADERSAKAHMFKRLLTPAAKRARVDAVLFEQAQQMVAENARIQAQRLTQPDEAAQPFAKFLAQLFTYGIQNEAQRQALDYFGYNIGKWIYWVDALDDYDKDLKSGAYNPWGILGLEKPAAVTRALNALGQCARGALMALDVMDIKRDGEILHNIAAYGMPAVADLVAKGGEGRAKSLRGFGRAFHG